MAALCKSNGKDTFQTLSGTAWQGNSMGAAWAWHAMCESAFIASGSKEKEPKDSDLTFKKKLNSTTITIKIPIPWYLSGS
jgi:hypothetical protein